MEALLARLFGILNLSPDSFSDGGRYSAVPKAIAHGRQLAEDGAWAVDIGAVSSHPDSAGVTADVELAALEPVITGLQARGIRCSIDTFNPTVQRALASRVKVLNDIRGFPDPDVWPALADASCMLVVMHALQDGRADRRDSDPHTILDDIERFFETRLNQLVVAGLSEERLVLDPGMGFFLGANIHTSLAVLREFPRLRTRFGLPVLLSVSRKSFLGQLVGGREPLQRAATTLAAELYAIQHGADYIRTHAVRDLRDALTVDTALRTPTR